MKHIKKINELFSDIDLIYNADNTQPLNVDLFEKGADNFKQLFRDTLEKNVDYYRIKYENKAEHHESFVDFYDTVMNKDKLNNFNIYNMDDPNDQAFEVFLHVEEDGYEFNNDNDSNSSPSLVISFGNILDFKKNIYEIDGHAEIIEKYEYDEEELAYKRYDDKYKVKTIFKLVDITIELFIDAHNWMASTGIIY